MTRSPPDLTPCDCEHCRSPGRTPRCTCPGPCRHSGRSGGGPYSGTLLVLEADSRLRHALQRLLAAHGYEVVTTASAAMAPVHVGRADLVLVGGTRSTDQCALCHEIRRSADPFLQIVVLSGDSRPARIAECLGAGADDYLSQPIAGRELLARIHTRLRRRGLELALLAMTPPDQMRSTVEILGALLRRSSLPDPG